MTLEDSSDSGPGITLPDEGEVTCRSFDQDYIVETQIQSGSFGTVYTTRHVASNQVYAVKIVDRTKLKPKDDANTLQEIRVMKDLNGVKNIVQLIDVYVTPKSFHIVQVFAEGGDVFDRLAKCTAYTENDARALAKTLLQILKEIHEKKVCHRDLKPENLLLKGRWDDSAILLADFGFAKYIPDEGLKTRCGTPAFVAPEIIQGLYYNQKVDMWSAGCLIYMLIGGYPPFQDQNHQGLFRKIRAADFTFHSKYWDSVSVDAKQLLSGLLTVDPKARLASDQALQTGWLKLDPIMLSSRDLSGSIAEIKSFNARRKLKSAMAAVFWSVASNFKHDKVSDLMKDAEKKDASSGTIEEPPEEPEKHKFKMSLSHKQGFAQTYNMGPKIHGGSFAVVYECHHKRWDQDFAVKVVKRDGKPETDEAVLHEIAVMKDFDHPNVVKVVDFYEEEDFYFIVMELLTGGDVFDRILDMKMYTEKDARDLAKFLLETVQYMHNLGIAHRDIKPQNLLLMSKEDHATIKIADFGFAKRVHTPKSLNTRCGTPSYVAPEILKNQAYDQSCDMWSCGVVLYTILCGYTPFAADNQEKMFTRIKEGNFSFDPEDWTNVSQDAKDLIKSLLQVDPDKRLTASQALKSKWISEAEDGFLSGRQLSQAAGQIKERRPRLRALAKAFVGLGINSILKIGGSRNASPENLAEAEGSDSDDSAIKIV